MRKTASWLWLILTAACTDAGHPLPQSLVVDSAHILVSSASEAVAHPTALRVDAQGHLWVLDRLAATLLIVGPDGQIRRSIGRQGSGPGETRTPIAFAMNGDTVRVLDTGNRRIVLFDTTGRHVGLAPMAPRILSGPRSYRDDGWIAVGTRGLDSVLAQVYDAHGNLRATIGTPVVPPSRVWNFRDIKDDLVRGIVPQILLNVVLPVFSHDDGYWLLWEADPRVRRYDAAGTVAFDTTLNEPAFDRIREASIEANRRIPEPTRMASLNYFADAKEIGGRLWVLLNIPDPLPSVLLILDRDGSLWHRVTFTGVLGAQKFAVDAERDWIHFGIRDDASIRGAPLPAGLLPTP